MVPKFYFSVNRRLDEWVELDKFDLTQKVVEQPNKEIPAPLSNLAEALDSTDRKITRNQKRKHDEINHVQKV